MLNMPYSNVQYIAKLSELSFQFSEPFVKCDPNPSVYYTTRFLLTNVSKLWTMASVHLLTIRCKVS